MTEFDQQTQNGYSKGQKSSKTTIMFPPEQVFQRCSETAEIHLFEQR